MDAAFKYLSKTFFVFIYFSSQVFEFVEEIYVQSIHDVIYDSFYEMTFFFFILTFYATMFSNIIIDLCHIHCFINNVIKNSKMLHLTSHKFKTIIFPDRWAGKCYHFENQFLRLYAAQKTLMWVYFKCHKFNNSHFILTM